MYLIWCLGPPGSFLPPFGLLHADPEEEDRYAQKHRPIDLEQVCRDIQETYEVVNYLGRIRGWGKIGQVAPWQRDVGDGVVDRRQRMKSRENRRVKAKERG